MASVHTLTGSAFDLARIPKGSTVTDVFVFTNLPTGEALIDRTTKGIHLGGLKANLNTSTAQFSVDLTDTDATDLNVTAGTLQYEVRIDYVDAATRTPRTWRSGWFGLTADADLADLAADASPLAVESASAYAQDAAASAALARSISEIDTTDAAIKTTLELPGSQSGEYLSATYGTVVPLSRLGGGPDKTGAQNRVALQAGIDAGLAIFVPPGITEVAGGLVPKAGMRIIGFGKGYPDTDDTCSILRTVDGPLFLPNTTSGDGFTNFASFQNIDLQAAFAALAPMMVGEWATTEFRNVRLRQYHPNHPVVDVTGWIDVVIDGASEIAGPANATAPLFRAITDVSKIAQSAFRDIRVTGGENYQFWIEATGGDALDYVQGIVFDNISHEIPHGGGYKLLSCRGVTINACGNWDRSIASPNDFIYLGAGSTDHPSGAITISHCVRDASANPPTGTYDIKAEAGTFDLNMVNNGVHQGGAAGWRVDAGGATGRISGTLPAIFDNADNIRRDVGSTPTLAVNMVADPLFATTLTSGLWQAVSQTPTGSNGELTMTATAAAFAVQTFLGDQTALAPCVAGTAYRVTAEVRSVGADRGVNLALNAFVAADMASLIGSADTGITATTGEWKTVSATYTPPSNGFLAAQLGASFAATGAQVKWRNLRIQPASDPAAFVNGNLPGCYWTGAANRSQSVRAHASTTSDLPASGPVKTGRSTTTARPSAASAGAGSMFYDTTLSKPIWSDGTVWKDATGTTV